MATTEASDSTVESGNGKFVESQKRSISPESSQEDKTEAEKEPLAKKLKPSGEELMA